jgi:hypothetical protein
MINFCEALQAVRQLLVAFDPYLPASHQEGFVYAGQMDSFNVLSRYGKITTRFPAELYQNQRPV